MERAMLKQRKMRSPAWHSVHLLKKSCSPLSPSSRPFAGASAAMTFAVPTLVAKSKTESPVVMAVFKYPCAACVSSDIDCATCHASPRLCCKCLRHLFAGVTREDGLLLIVIILSEDSGPGTRERGLRRFVPSIEKLGMHACWTGFTGAWEFLASDLSPAEHFTEARGTRGAPPRDLAAPVSGPVAAWPSGRRDEDGVLPIKADATSGVASRRRERIGTIPKTRTFLRCHKLSVESMNQINGVGL